MVNSATDIDPYTDGDGDGYYKICGNLTVKPNRTLRLKSGIYYVEDGHILFQGDVEMYDSTDRVTIVLTGTDPSDVGEIDIRAQADVELFATNTPGPYKGIAFMQDTDADTSGDNKFNGGASLDIRGYLYMKNQALTYSGGSAGVAGQFSALDLN